MSDLQRSPFYKEDGDFVFQLGSTLYKVEADTFLTQSWPLKARIDRSVPNYKGSSDDNPFRLNSEIIAQDDFDALIEFYYNPATADTREKCLSILLACFALTLPETEATVQAILETIDSSSAPAASVNAANMKADKLLAKYQKQLRHINDLHATVIERFKEDWVRRHSEESRDDAENSGT
ncbi:hypothetical protein ARMSODRAFT_788345 [Armillaria solidipes]|uniref:BTB domain-containing protein n=1 Tax=Armillaria solidipes TaxID=1076256 RepID=A0A2H3BLG4_9AGAR|nr:hypothetical protein ARMSODRAFT_788345 [Armillaria solidipes]